MTPFTYHPVTPDTLPDLQQFSAQHGKFRYCSCMRSRLASSQFSKSNKEERIAALDALVCDRVPVGVLAYADGRPVRLVLHRPP